MCGLVSIFAYEKNAPAVDKQELITIRDHMLARGPDGCGAWLSDNKRIGLGHRRLAIIDTSNDGLQPMLSINGRVRIVFNGEIYNYQALRTQLLAKGHTFISQSDTEVLLAGWLEWGEQLVTHLRGMFAFVLWDEDKQGLFLARDTFGIKPLYIADDGKTLRCASQVKALLAGRNVDTTLNPAGHVGFFLWGHVPEPHTLYKGIRAFPAGNALWIDRDGQRREYCFSSVPNLIQQAEENSRYWSVTEIQERLRTAVRDSMQKHLIADVPVGIFLSSGIDSCTLAALATEVSTIPIHTLTLGFHEYRGLVEDETPLAEIMAQQLNSRHETHWIAKSDFEQDYTAFIQAMDQPSIDGLNTWFVCKVAKQAGLTVAISGLGGDELLGGYPSFKQIPSIVRYLQHFHGLRHTLGRTTRNITANWMGKLTSSKYAGLLEYGTTYPGAYLLRRSVFMPWELGNHLPQEIIQAGLPQVLEELYSTLPINILSDKGKVSVLESSLYMRNQLLRDSDWASMAHSIELRVPLVDIEVIVATARANKEELANSVRLKLPEQISTRPKTGFMIPIRNWITETNRTQQMRGLRSWVQHIYEQPTFSTP